MNSSKWKGVAPSILVMIPTYNDTELISDIAGSIHDLLENCTVLIIDDGSSPSVKMLDISENSLLAILPTNFGLGMAMHIALDHQIDKSYDILVRVDADGQHPIENIPNLIAPIAAGQASYVVGNRSNRDKGAGIRSWLAKFVRSYMSMVIRLVSGKSMPDDVTSGFIALDLKAAKVLNQTVLEQYPEPQMSLLVGRSNLKVSQILFDQNDRAFGKSTISVGQALRFLYRFNIIVLASLFQSGPRI